MSSQTSAGSEVATAGGHGGEHGSPLRVASDSKTEPEAHGVLKKLTQCIEDLHVFVKAKNNIHHEVKQRIRSIRTLVKEAADKLKEGNGCLERKPTKKRGTSIGTQTEGERKSILGTPRIGSWTPSGKNVDKRRREGERSQTKSSPWQKRQKSAQDSEATDTVSERETEDSERETEDSEMDVDTTVIHTTTPKTTPKKKPRARRRKQTETEVAPTEERKREKADTRRIPKTKKAKGKMLKRARPDAIVVEKVGEASYADILKQVKGDPTLKEMGEKVVRIKRTQKGQMMFELRREEDQKGAAYQSLVEGALRGVATVKVLTQEVNIVCKDLDEVTTKEELLRALKEQFDLSNIREDAIRSLRAAYGSTQTAIISLPLDAARRALSVGRVKIGWTMCRLREYVRPKSCFRCLGFGHLAKDCKGVDRSKMCRRCGGEGHIAKTCTIQPRCLLCDKTGDQSQQHITGSSSCPKYRNAMKKIRS